MYSIGFISSYLIKRSMNLSNYNVIAFDLDNTLCEYNLENIFKLQYNFLSNYLVQKKGYDVNTFSDHLTDTDADFIRRGLFTDFKKGNILELRYDGFILSASHGTHRLTELDIENIYGPDRKWWVTDEYINNALSTWNGPLTSEVRCFQDFTDCIGTLIFAKLVDSIDNKMKKTITEYHIWPDLLHGIIAMYDSENWFIKEIYENKLHFLKECDGLVKEWLLKIKNNSKIILITSASPESAQFTLSTILGPNYKIYFDILIYSSKKPGFFINSTQPFVNLFNKKVDNLIWGGEYLNGNWNLLSISLTKLLKKDIVSVYIGDSPIADILAPSVSIPKLDTIAMMEEAASEGFYPEIKNYPYKQYVSSGFWGSYFIYQGNELTYFGDMFKKKSKLIIPNIKFLAEKPINFAFISNLY